MRRERVLRTGAKHPHDRHSYSMTVIPAHNRHSGVGRNPEARKRRIPLSLIRGEDAANAAGEGTADDARSAPMTVIPAHNRHSGVGRNPEARKRRIPLSL